MSNDAEQLDTVEEESTNAAPKLKSTVSRTDESGRKAKGRGFGKQDDHDAEERYSGRASEFDSIDDTSKGGPQRSVEGWIVFATGIHEEASEDDVHDKFGEFGEVKNLHLPLDRRTGFVKGYALIEYEKKEEAEEAIKNLNDSQFMDQTIHVDWTFEKGPSTKAKSKGKGSSRYNRQ
eukprot:TRINITY_DN1423_c0_g1_i1.p1 TRINITY_DN1423_c0_g1~~TRINITY_DN1423_c0_g1_i1.p1  ORF type:complete len:177 (-),score=43.31 TRINITY_DN1423_c0_g1_i1:1-531(-)